MDLDSGFRSRKSVVDGMVGGECSTPRAFRLYGLFGSEDYEFSHEYGIRKSRFRASPSRLLRVFPYSADWSLEGHSRDRMRCADWSGFRASMAEPSKSLCEHHRIQTCSPRRPVLRVGLWGFGGGFEALGSGACRSKSKQSKTKHFSASHIHRARLSDQQHSQVTRT